MEQVKNASSQELWARTFEEQETYNQRLLRAKVTPETTTLAT